ncbi:MAG: hypothetical protein ACKPKO_15860 [Candidatus Fonsibacter sp.]
MYDQSFIKSFEKHSFLSLAVNLTSEPYSFLYVKLTAKNKNEMFYQNFDKRLIIQDID